MSTFWNMSLSSYGSASVSIFVHFRKRSSRKLPRTVLNSRALNAHFPLSFYQFVLIVSLRNQSDSFVVEVAVRGCVMLISDDVGALGAGDIIRQALTPVHPFRDFDVVRDFVGVRSVSM